MSKTGCCKDGRNWGQLYYRRYERIRELIKRKIENDQYCIDNICGNMSVDELIRISDYLRSNYFNDAPMSCIMSEINNYVIKHKHDRGLASVSLDTINYINMIIKDDIEKMKTDEFRRRFEEANKKSWFKNWLG